MNEINKKNEKIIPLRDGRSLSRGRTNVMGILNVNDDSFYAGSRAPSIEDALQKIRTMSDDGADILDIGAESTRPGSHGMDAAEEERALIPVIRLAREQFPHLPISVDTRKARVARAAVLAGADIVNDVSGLLLEEERDEMIRVVAETRAAYVLMHTRGTPQTMQNLTDYENFWADLTQFFERGVADLTDAGIPRERIILDPGIGFAKRVCDNLEIVANLRELKQYALPVLIGASRKGFLGKLPQESRPWAPPTPGREPCPLHPHTGSRGLRPLAGFFGQGAEPQGLDPLPPSERLEGTLAVTALCADAGIEIVRVHDVRENVRVIRAIEAAKRYRHG